MSSVYDQALCLFLSTSSCITRKRKTAIKGKLHSKAYLAKRFGDRTDKLTSAVQVSVAYRNPCNEHVHVSHMKTKHTVYNTREGGNYSDARIAPKGLPAQ